MLILLVIFTLAAFAGALILLLADASNAFAALHLAFAAGVMPLILGAISHFVPVLTRSGAAPPMARALPLAALFAGWLAVSAFAVPAMRPLGLNIAAALGVAIAAGMAAWIRLRAVRALGRPHPCLHWYAAAVLCLVVALLAVIAMDFFPAQRLALRRFHLHLNTLGFVALTAVGTLQVLLPTAAGRADSDAAARLHTDLKWAVSGALLTAAGAAWAGTLAWVGLALWAIPLVRLAAAWVEQFGAEIFSQHGGAPSLGAALLGLMLLVVDGALHAGGLLAGTDAMPAFFLGFLLPLVTGAISHLLPLWIRPGVQTHWHAHVRQGLSRLSGMRALAFLAAGILLAAGIRKGFLLALAGLALFLLQAAHTLASARRTYA